MHFTIPKELQFVGNISSWKSFPNEPKFFNGLLFKLKKINCASLWMLMFYNVDPPNIIIRLIISSSGFVIFSGDKWIDLGFQKLEKKIA